MEVGVMDEMMTKPKGRPAKPSGEGTPVRIDADIVTMARYVAARRGVHLSVLMSELVRPAVEREFRKAGKELLEGSD